MDETICISSCNRKENPLKLCENVHNETNNSITSFQGFRLSI